MNNLITIFTPTYNRETLLPNLYYSLCNQTNNNFIWLIVDDGSNDNTKDLIARYLRENKVRIEYFVQENRGKYIAHNKGVELCNTELFVCVDSDDELYSNAIERILSFWETIRENKRIAGIVSPKKMGNISYFYNQPKFSTLIDLYRKKQLFGETMLVYRCEVLKKYLFPEINGEKFMSERIIYDQIDQKYLLATLDEYLYSAKYYEDGLTKNAHKTSWNNPNSTLLLFKHIAAYDGFCLNAMKHYGAYLAWKRVRNLSSCDASKKVPLIVKWLGWLFQFHYIRLFSKLKEEYEKTKK